MLAENSYQQLQEITFKARTGRSMNYPVPVELHKEIRYTCPDCEDYPCVDSHNDNYYYICWTCGWIEYISPERHKRIMDDINSIEF